MSLLTNMRDVVANIALVKAMESVRTRQLAAIREGTAVDARQLGIWEKEALTKVVNAYYSAEKSAQLGLTGADVNYKEQYRTRGTDLADLAAMENHRLLCALPIVGEPKFDVGAQ